MTIETIIMILILVGYALALVVNRNNNAVRKEILIKTVKKIEKHDTDLEKLNSAMWSLRADVGLLDRRLGMVDVGLKSLTPAPVVVEEEQCCLDEECCSAKPSCDCYDLEREDP